MDAGTKKASRQLAPFSVSASDLGETISQSFPPDRRLFAIPQSGLSLAGRLTPEEAFSALPLAAETASKRS